MNDPLESELRELEAELRRLRPAPMAPEFAERLAAAAPPTARAAGSGPRLAWACFAGAGLAAGLALVFLLASRSQAEARTAAIDFKPVSAEAVVTSAQDHGYVVLGDGTPARRIGESIVDTVTWRNPTTHATVTWSVPREEERIIPVRYY